MPIFKHCAKFAQCFFHAVLAQYTAAGGPVPETAFGVLCSRAITDETIGRVIQFCFDRAKDVVGKQ